MQFSFWLGRPLFSTMTGFHVYLFLLARARKAPSFGGPMGAPPGFVQAGPAPMGNIVESGPRGLFAMQGIPFHTDGCYVLETTPQQDIRDFIVWASYESASMFRLGSMTLENQGPLRNHPELSALLELQHGPMCNWPPHVYQNIAGVMHSIAGVDFSMLYIFKSFEGGVDAYFRDARDQPHTRFYHYRIIDVADPSAWWTSRVPMRFVAIRDDYFRDPIVSSRM